MHEQQQLNSSVSIVTGYVLDGRRAIFGRGNNRHHCDKTDYGIGIHFVPVSWVLKMCPGVPQNTVRDAKCAGFPSHKNTTFLTMRTNILTSPQWDKTATGFGEPSTSHQQEGIGQGVRDV
jgi:hypothetical protein